MAFRYTQNEILERVSSQGWEDYLQRASRRIALGAFVGNKGIQRLMSAFRGAARRIISTHPRDREAAIRVARAFPFVRHDNGFARYCGLAGWDVVPRDLWPEGHERVLISVYTAAFYGKIRTIPDEILTPDVLAAPSRNFGRIYLCAAWGSRDFLIARRHLITPELLRVTGTSGKNLLHVLRKDAQVPSDIFSWELLTHRTRKGQLGFEGLLANSNLHLLPAQFWTRELFAQQNREGLTMARAVAQKFIDPPEQCPPEIRELIMAEQRALVASGESRPAEA